MFETPASPESPRVFATPLGVDFSTALIDGIEAMGEAGMKRLDDARAAGLRFALAWPVVVVDRVRAAVLMMG